MVMNALTHPGAPGSITSCRQLPGIKQKSLAHLGEAFFEGNVTSADKYTITFVIAPSLPAVANATTGVKRSSMIRLQCVLQP